MIITDFGWMAGFISHRADVALALFRLGLALWVTIQVLLHKRNVRAAAAWIGLGWITPILGALLYFSFGINRVVRRARKLRTGDTRDDPVPELDARDDYLAPLEIAVRVLTKRPPTEGNAVQVFHDGDEAYPRMLDAIGEAKASIGLSSYIFFDDAGGRPFIEALVAAQRRGVAVRVLVDGIGSGYFRSGAWEHLHREGVPAARFLHSSLPWRMPFLNLRSHKKILVIDGHVGFTGGMNISAANLLDTHPAEPVRDTHFRFDGPVVGQLTEAFTADWQFVTDEELSGEAWFPAPQAAGEAAARVITSGPDQDLEKILFVILQAVGCARERIAVMTPYFLPDERLLTALSLAAMRGVAVDVIVPEHSDHAAVDWAARATVGPLLAAGGRVWQNPPPFEHTKVMVVDANWCLVGSSNWDTRSFRLNFELNVETYHSDLAARLEARIEQCKVKPLTLDTLRARSLPVRLRDAAMRLSQPYL